MPSRGLCLAILCSVSACSLASSGLGPGVGGQGGESGSTSSASSASASSSSGGVVDTYWDSTFARRVRITFNNDSGEELTDFPVMVKLDPTRIDYGAASPTGADLRFVGADGKTLLSHEIDRWSPAGDSFIWVRVPKIDKASSADHMWLYYSNPAATDGQSPAAVWAGFVGVYHLSRNANDLTAVASSASYPGKWSSQIGDPVPGVIGEGVELSGTQFVQVGDINDFSVNPGEARTVEVWVNPKALKEEYIVYQEGQCKGWSVGINKDGKLTGHLSADADADVCGTYKEYFVTQPAATGVWRYVTLVMNRPASEMRLLVDGVLADSKAIDNAASADGNGAFLLGTDWDHSHSFSGSIDEVRVSSSARSDGWIAAQHRSMMDQFLTFKAE